MTLALDHLPAFLVTTTIQGLPALVALIAWSEGGGKLLRQYGARMLWEMAGLVALGIGILLYASVRLLPDEGPNTAAVIVTAVCAVPVVTLVTQRFRIDSSPIRLTLAAGVGYVALETSLIIGLVVSMLFWSPRP